MIHSPSCRHGRSQEQRAKSTKQHQEKGAKQQKEVTKPGKEKRERTTTKKERKNHNNERKEGRRKKRNIQAKKKGNQKNINTKEKWKTKEGRRRRRRQRVAAPWPCGVLPWCPPGSTRAPRIEWCIPRPRPISATELELDRWATWGDLVSTGGFNFLENT